MNTINTKGDRDFYDDDSLHTGIYPRPAKTPFGEHDGTGPGPAQVPPREPGIEPEGTERTCRWVDDGHSLITQCGNAERSMGRWLWCPYCRGKIITKDAPDINFTPEPPDREKYVDDLLAEQWADIVRLRNECEDAHAHIHGLDKALEVAKQEIAILRNNPGPANVPDREKYVDDLLAEKAADIARLESLNESLNEQIMDEVLRGRRITK